MTEPKVKEDKRKLTSGDNLKKARQVKIDKQKKEKLNKSNKYEFDEDSSDDSSSDDDAIVIKSKKKQKSKPKQDPTNVTEELTQIKDLLQALTVKKQRKPKRSKQVIVVNPPAAEPKKSSPETDLIKQRMLANFN